MIRSGSSFSAELSAFRADDGPIENVESLVESLREVRNRHFDEPMEPFDETVEWAKQRVRDQGDIWGYTLLALFDAIRIERSGDSRELIDYYDRLVAEARSAQGADAESAVAVALGTQAIALCSRPDDVSGAVTLVAELESLAARSLRPRASAYATATSSAIPLMAMTRTPPGLADLASAIDRCLELGEPDLASWLGGWAMRHGFMRGEWRTAAFARLRSLVFEALAQKDNIWRRSDYEQVIDAIQSTDGLEVTRASPRDQRYHMAARTYYLRRLRRALLIVEPDAALDALEVVERAGRNAFLGSSGGGSITPALASLDGSSSDPPRPPPALTIFNVGEAIGGADLAAAMTDPAVARVWQSWMAQQPDYLLTSIEWPSSVQRVRGLLDARAGDLDSARGRLLEARSWAGELGLRVEEALATVQLDALTGDSLPRDAVFAARRFLSQREINPQAPAVPLLRALVDARREAAGGRVTPREREVIETRIRTGTVRAAARDLGISPNTVSELSRRVYRKLGMRGNALREAARALGIAID